MQVSLFTMYQYCNVRPSMHKFIEILKSDNKTNLFKLFKYTKASHQFRTSLAYISSWQLILIFYIFHVKCFTWMWMAVQIVALRISEHEDAAKGVKLRMDMTVCRENSLAKSELSITTAMKNVYFAAEEDLANSIVPKLNTFLLHQVSICEINKNAFNFQSHYMIKSDQDSNLT